MEYKMLRTTGSIRHQKKSPQRARKRVRAAGQDTNRLGDKADPAMPQPLDFADFDGTPATASPPGKKAVAFGAHPPNPYLGKARKNHKPETHKSMFYYTVEEGERAVVVEKDGQTTIVNGPAKIRKWGRVIRPMARFTAHPGEFLIVRFKDGRQEHLAGPAEVWRDDRIHTTIEREDALQIDANEAIVVYSRDAENPGVGAKRRIMHGPQAFIPAPGEWIHEFSWHGAAGSDEKQAGGLRFSKLWLLPDQMYHNVHDVRTADDAVLTIKLMIFFELVDVEKMLDTTHDPIGDLINAATSDITEFVGRYQFDTFKEHSHQLNEAESYKQLNARAEHAGYRIIKVVYRGYGAPESLQQMLDKAIESRTKLKLDKATEQQSQELADYKQERELARREKERGSREADEELDLTQLQKRQTAEREFRRANNEDRLEFLRQLKESGVDLTEYLTQDRADRVFEIRGSNGDAHLHLDAARQEPAE